MALKWIFMWAKKITKPLPQLQVPDHSETNTVGEPVGGRNWYSPKRKKRKNDSGPRHVLD